MPGDERLNLLLSTLARVAISVELEPTLQILLNSLHEVVPFDAGGIFVRDATDHVVRARVTRGYAGDLKMPADESPRSPHTFQSGRQPQRNSRSRSSRRAECSAPSRLNPIAHRPLVMTIWHWRSCLPSRPPSSSSAHSCTSRRSGSRALTVTLKLPGTFSRA